MSALFHSKPKAFVAEWTLGKLARWLRLAGFDTLYDVMPPDFRRLSQISRSCHRLILSRTKSVAHRLGTARCLLIQHNAPIDQVRQVIKHLDLRPGDLAPLSRCSDCNCLLKPAKPADLQTAVPDYILQRHERFLVCDQCHRLFWPGTHSHRITALIEHWFEE